MSCGKRIRWTGLLVLTLLFSLPPTVRAGTKARQPNIVFILADDLGWSDLGCYGSTFHATPNIDALAEKSMRFTQAYAANPLCSPTRGSILTGLHPARLGITAPACHLPQEVLKSQLVKKGPPQNPALHAVSATRLTTDHFTLAKLLKSLGYVTAHFGKWHLGLAPYSPKQHGFDTDVPGWHGPGPSGSYLAPWKSPKFALQAKPGDHVEDRLTDEAVAFIRRHRDRPFFLNYWAFSVHSPYDSKPDLVEKYRKKARPGAPQRHPVYAAMVECLDHNVGRLLRALVEAGVADDTLVIFFSDNGGVHWAGDARMFADVPITSNRPLRGGKATLYEGGIRVPLLVRWPGKTRPGSRSDAVVQSTDFLPTLAEILGVALKKNQAVDGRSFVPALLGKQHERGPTFCHFPHYTPKAGGRAATSVRSGDWKLIRFYCEGEDLKNRFELYDLRKDIGEKNDLSEAYPERVRALDRSIDDFLRETGAVVPSPNPAYRKKT